jgi:hypothetical protein
MHTPPFLRLYAFDPCHGPRGGLFAQIRGMQGVCKGMGLALHKGGNA